MALCAYCGRPAGLLKKMHAECHDRHERAMSLIPEFLPKFFESQLTNDRFRQLLEDAAKASFIKPEELKTLLTDGVSNTINSILDQRLLSKADMLRIAQITDALASLLPDDIYPYESFAKIDILHELQNGNVPDLVTVAGPMPIEMTRGETVIWIFNYVASYDESREASKADRTGIELPLGSAAYYGPRAFKNVAVPRSTLRKGTQGDLVVTNRRLYFLIDDLQCEKVPLMKLISLHAYADGIQIKCAPAVNRTRTFILNDAWFAANLIIRLFNFSYQQVDSAATTIISASMRSPD